MEQAGHDLLGDAQPAGHRFPLLVKILDAQEKLSLQVHPPPTIARELDGEAKTEVWYVAEARPGAELFVGLKKGTTRDEFERRIRSGTVEQCFHRVGVQNGDVMFLPSGRVHAIGAGNVIFEVQQNRIRLIACAIGIEWMQKDDRGAPHQPVLGQHQFQDGGRIN
jgi:mannose-6-phosphate isomerase